ncbi:hypothetical protein L873DRAFT_1684348 [Choiromyces venosus 120613-1]|uniref:C2H2-type domain-containing protein n=1 Tax=Choiromyces venosus 120613-1 TaxID=1336337 RepID=A0A3N4JLZ4_9PEZI|nr:hypothetical protein L873DRAFT_1684348 [Choiromyces venosus 120613-1]
MAVFCKPCWATHANGEHRSGSRKGCPTCSVTFHSKAAFRRHMRDPNSQCSPSEFRCCDCNRDFASVGALYAHLTAEHPNSGELPPRTRGVHYCEECDKSFKTPKRLRAHRANARVHNPLLEEKVGCVGGCKKKFDAPSSLLHHLESGACKSGITRDKLDKAIIAQDRTYIITDAEAVLARQTRNFSLMNSDVSSICGGSFDTPDDSNDAGSIYAQFDGLPTYHTAGGVSLTPNASLNEASSSSGGSGLYAPSGSSTGTVTPTAGVGGPGGIPIHSPPFSTSSFSTDNHYTPSTGSVASNQPVLEPNLDQLRPWLLPDGTFECPICPETAEKSSFPTFGELQTHMQSPTSHPHLHNINHLPNPHSPPISMAPESGIATPSTVVAHPYCLPNGKYECPLCPLGSRRVFKTLGVLQTHMLSPIAHMPKIYHCPDPKVFGITLPPSTKMKKEKSFMTLSALAQHVESGACQGGRTMFNAMVGFVNEKVANMGMGDMRMIASG